MATLGLRFGHERAKLSAAPRHASVCESAMMDIRLMRCVTSPKAAVPR